jgi:membrane associated rhomboid family serine protease
VFLPIGDEPNVRGRIPWVNYALIATNVAVFVVVVVPTLGDRTRYETLMFAWGYLPSLDRPITILTSMFLHGGWMHLLGNMLFLWIFGDNIEARLGAIGYLVAYLAVGAAATLVFGVFNADATLPCVGASGAISGVQGLYFVACPRHRVRVLVWLYFYVTLLSLPARSIMLFWFVLKDLLPVLLRVPGQVAHMAHLGGFASGLVLMLLLRPLLGRDAAVEEHDGIG